MRSNEDAAPAGPVRGDLLRLVETEEQLDRRLAAAHDEATRLIADARAAAGEGERRLEGDWAQLARLLAAEAEAERARLCREIEDAARRDVAAFDAIDEARIAALVDHVVARVLGMTVP